MYILVYRPEPREYSEYAYHIFTHIRFNWQAVIRLLLSDITPSKTFVRFGASSSSFGGHLITSVIHSFSFHLLVYEKTSITTPTTTTTRVKKNRLRFFNDIYSSVSCGHFGRSPELCAQKSIQQRVPKPFVCECCVNETTKPVHRAVVLEFACAHSSHNGRFLHSL